MSRLVDLGDFYFRSENHLSALEAYEQARVLQSHFGDGRERGLLEIKLARCHQARGNFQLALEHLDRAKADLRSQRDSIQLGKLYAVRGDILLKMGQYARSQRYCELAYKLLRGTGENATLGKLELCLGSIAARLGDGARARDYFTRALATYRRIDDEVGIASALNNLGIQHKNSCDWREAIRCFNSALELSERQAISNVSASIRLNLGIVYYKLGDWALAEEYLNKSRQLAAEIGFTPCLVAVHLAQGNLDRRRRRWDSALELYQKANELAEQNGYSREAILAGEFLGELYLDRGELDAAAELLVAGLARAEKVAPLGDLINEICRRLAEVRLAQGNAPEALSLGQRALSSSSKINDQYERAITCRVVGLAYARLGQVGEAEQFVGEAIDSLTRIGESFELARTLLSAGLSLDWPENRAADAMKQAFGMFLSLDSRGYAALASFEVASHHSAHDRLDESILYLDRAMSLTNKAEEPELWERITGLRHEVENAYAARWVRFGGGIDSFKELAGLFRGSADVETVLAELVRLGVVRTRSDRGFVAFGDTPSQLKIMARHGIEPGEAEKVLARLARTLRDAVSENRPTIVSQVGSDSRFTGEATASLHDVRSFALLPLALPPGGPGVFYVDRLEANVVGNFNQGDLNLLTLVCSLAALSILEHQRKELLQENRSLKIQLWNQPYSEIVTQNPRMIEILRLAEKVSECAASILIEGETGTGKGLIAQAIHNHSKRRDKPFIQVNCAALPEQLLESELFGHVQGAFTGAIREKIGLFKEAEGGTLFLDEVDKTSEALQSKLLHVLDQKEIRPVGSTRWQRVDTRVICATNVDLRERIQGGRFLEDLYYRLNDFIIRVPPLRERRDDIPLLIDYFLGRFCTQYGKTGVTLSPEVRRTLVGSAWRGNVRELEKAVRRMVVLAEEHEPIGVDLLPTDCVAPDAGAESSRAGASLREEVARTERRVIADALARSQWNKSAVARELRISYPCLLKKIKELGLERRSLR